MISVMSQGIFIVCGCLVAAGVVLMVRGCLPSHPRLGDVLARMDDNLALPEIRSEIPAVRSERAGAWLLRRGWLPLSAGQHRMLELQGKSVTEFGADKLIMTIVGVITPTLAAAMLGILAGWPVTVPVIAGLAGGVGGWFVPDLLLRRGATVARSSAGEALFTYFDLVVLERMANLSASQSLTSAAALSDVPLFRRVRAALTRARLQQQPPWEELRRLSARLNVPELNDIADVMRLDESGAALTETLRARVCELRDAHLAATRIAAHEVSERMTVFMVLPAMIFGLIFLIPPMLRLTGVA